MNQPLISFVIPVYGAEKYLDRCVKSILIQNIKNWELILVDDESPDSSGEICEKFSKQDKRIKVIHRKNGGQGAARNTGADIATGKWLMFIDDDDWLDENMCTECVPYLTDDIDILTFCRRDVYNKFSKDSIIGIPDGQLIFETKDEKRVLQTNTLNYFAPHKYALNKVFWGVPWAKFIRNTFWRENQLKYVEGASEDRPCLLKAYGCARKVLHIDKCFYNYWIHESTVRKYLENAYSKYDLSLRVVHEYVDKNLRDSDECIEALYHMDIAYFSHYVIQDYCHRLNPQPYYLRKKRFQQDIQKHIFRESFKNADLSCLPLRRRVLAMIIRKENFFLINSLCKANDIWNKLIYN